MRSTRGTSAARVPSGPFTIFKRIGWPIRAVFGIETGRSPSQPRKLCAEIRIPSRPICFDIVHQFLHLLQANRCYLRLLWIGVDDTSASNLLHVGVPAIKRRWNSIFDRVGAIQPHLCPQNESGVRGLQKRQRVLSYIRSHPEELRPFDFETKRSRRQANPATD